MSDPSATGKKHEPTLTQQNHTRCGSYLYRVGSDRDLFCVACETKVEDDGLRADGGQPSTGTEREEVACEDCDWSFGAPESRRKAVLRSGFHHEILTGHDVDRKDEIEEVFAL